MLLIAILLMLGLSSTLIAKASAASWGAKKKSIQRLNVRGVIGIIRKMVKLESLELLLIR